MCIIKTTRDLNAFLALNRVNSPKLIIPELEKRKQVVSNQMAKLILKLAA